MKEPFTHVVCSCDPAEEVMEPEKEAEKEEAQRRHQFGPLGLKFIGSDPALADK